MEYAGKVALCKKPENIYVGTCEGLGDYGSYVSDMVQQIMTPFSASTPPALPIMKATARAALPYGFLKSEGREVQGAVGNGWKIIGFDDEAIICRSVRSTIRPSARRG